MTRWLIAWEMGHGLGHLAGVTAVARQALLHGIEPVITSSTALPDSIVLPEGARFLLAPAWRAPQTPLPGTSSMTELLFEQGFADPQSLTLRVQRFRDLIELVGAEVVVADHAPTALLTAAALGIPALQCGTGFAIPPSDGVHLLPSFRTWETPNIKRMAQAEALTTEALRLATASTGLPLAASVAALYRAPAVIRSVPLLDHYPVSLRGAATRYSGPLELTTASVHAHSAPPNWPEIAGDDTSKILAYLKASHPLTLPILNALAQHAGRNRLSVLVYVEGAEGVSNPHLNIHIQSTPLPFKTLLAGAAQRMGPQLVIHQGGIGVSSQALLAGVPQLLLPDMAEAFITAQTLAAAGVAELLRPEASRDAVQQALTALINEPHYGARAVAVAQENSEFQGNNEARLWRLLNAAIAA